VFRYIYLSEKDEISLNISKEDSTYILLEKIFNIIGSQKVKNYMASKPWEISQKFIVILRLIAVSFF